MNYEDTWYSSILNYGTTTDGIVWSGYTLKAYASDVNSNADCLCWDWWDDNEDDTLASIWSDCICKSTSARDQCKSYSSLVNTLCNAGSCWVDSLTNKRAVTTGTTGDKWVRYIDIKEIRDCDNSAGQRGIWNHLGQQGSASYVIYGVKYDCDDTAYYDSEGQYASSTWIDIVPDLSCVNSDYACDENHDDQISYDSDAYLDIPCKLKDNNYCGYNDDCISDNCAGTSSTVYRSHCMASSYYQKQKRDTEKCCTNACVGSWESLSGDYNCGTGYECDYGRDDTEYTSSSSLPALCYKSDVQPCSSNTECLAISSGCSGDKTEYVYTCPTDGGDTFHRNTYDYDNGCGNQPYRDTSGDTSTDYGCSATYGAGYVCDTYDSEYGGTYTSQQQICNKALGQSCASSTECWNNNKPGPDGVATCAYGGHPTTKYCVYSCLVGSYGDSLCCNQGSGECSSYNDCTDYYCSCTENKNGAGTCDSCKDKADANSCDCDAECSSGRCDSTCQTKLSDGNACDEASDCTGGYCVHGNCRSASTYCGDGYCDTGEPYCAADGCISCRDYNSDGSINSQDTKESIKIYFNLPGMVSGFTVIKAEVLDCINKYP